ncbi:MAG: AI-2E family transporter [Aureispira sp.]
MQSMFKKYSRYIGVIVTLLVLGFIFYYFSAIVTWVVLAWVISLLGSPLVAFMGKLQYKGWEIPSSIRAIVVLVLFYGIFSLLFYLFVPVIVQQGRELARVDYAALLGALEEPLDHVNDWLVERNFIAGELSGHIHPHHIDSVNSATIAPSMDTLPTEIPTPIVQTTTIHLDSILLTSGDSFPQTNLNLNIALNIDPSLLQGSSDSVTTDVLEQEGATGIDLLKAKLIDYISPSQIAARSVVYLVELLGNLLILISSVTFIAFFFLKDEKLFGTAIKALLPTGRLKEMDTALSAIKRLLTRYFSGILAQITVITIYVSILLSFLGIPNAFLIAFFAGIINVIPYLGPLLGAMFAMLVIISSNVDASFYLVTGPMLLKTCGVFASMQLIDGFILQPYIFSNSVSAHPLEIFIVVVLGANIGGITGMIVAIPVYTIIRVIAAVFLREFRLVQKLTQSMNYQDEEDQLLGENVDIEVEK